MEEFDANDFSDLNFESGFENILERGTSSKSFQSQQAPSFGGNDGPHTSVASGSSGLSFGPECSNCAKYRNDLERLDKEHRVNFLFLKKKVISTDLLIRRYKAKQVESDVQGKTIADLNTQLELARRDSQILSEQLNSAVESIKPMKEDNERMGVLLKDKETEINDLQLTIAAEEAYKIQRQAYDSAVKNMDSEVTQLKRRVVVLENKNQKLTAKSQELDREKTILKSETNLVTQRMNLFAKALMQAQNILNDQWKKVQHNGLTDGKRKPCVIPPRYKSVIAKIHANMTGKTSVKEGETKQDETADVSDISDDLNEEFNGSLDLHFDDDDKVEKLGKGKRRRKKNVKEKRKTGGKDDSKEDEMVKEIEESDTDLSNVSVFSDIDGENERGRKILKGEKVRTAKADVDGAKINKGQKKREESIEYSQAKEIFYRGDKNNFGDEATGNRTGDRRLVDSINGSDGSVRPAGNMPLIAFEEPKLPDVRKSPRFQRRKNDGGHKERSMEKAEKENDCDWNVESTKEESSSDVGMHVKISEKMANAMSGRKSHKQSSIGVKKNNAEQVKSILHPVESGRSVKNKNNTNSDEAILPDDLSSPSSLSESDDGESEEESNKTTVKKKIVESSKEVKKLWRSPRAKGKIRSGGTDRLSPNDDSSDTEEEKDSRSNGRNSKRNISHSGMNIKKRKHDVNVVSKSGPTKQKRRSNSCDDEEEADWLSSLSSDSEDENVDVEKNASLLSKRLNSSTVCDTMEDTSGKAGVSGEKKVLKAGDCVLSDLSDTVEESEDEFPSSLPFTRMSGANADDTLPPCPEVYSSKKDTESIGKLELMKLLSTLTPFGKVLAPLSPIPSPAPPSPIPSPVLLSPIDSPTVCIESSSKCDNSGLEINHDLSSQSIDNQTCDSNEIDNELNGNKISVVSKDSDVGIEGNKDIDIISKGNEDGDVGSQGNKDSDKSKAIDVSEGSTNSDISKGSFDSIGHKDSEIISKGNKDGDVCIKGNKDIDLTSEGNKDSDKSKAIDLSEGNTNSDISKGSFDRIGHKDSDIISKGNKDGDVCIKGNKDIDLTSEGNKDSDESKAIDVSEGNTNSDISKGIIDSMGHKDSDKLKDSDISEGSTNNDSDVSKGSKDNFDVESESNSVEVGNIRDSGDKRKGSPCANKCGFCDETSVAGCICSKLDEAATSGENWEKSSSEAHCQLEEDKEIAVPAVSPVRDCEKRVLQHKTLESTPSRIGKEADAIDRSDGSEQTNEKLGKVGTCVDKSEDSFRDVMNEKSCDQVKSYDNVIAVADITCDHEDVGQKIPTDNKMGERGEIDTQPGIVNGSSSSLKTAGKEPTVSAKVNRSRLGVKIGGSVRLRNRNSNSLSSLSSTSDDESDVDGSDERRDKRVLEAHVEDVANNVVNVDGKTRFGQQTRRTRLRSRGEKSKKFVTSDDGEDIVKEREKIEIKTLKLHEKNVTDENERNGVKRRENTGSCTDGLNRPRLNRHSTRLHVSGINVDWSTDDSPSPARNPKSVRETAGDSVKHGNDIVKTGECGTSIDSGKESDRLKEVEKNCDNLVEVNKPPIVRKISTLEFKPGIDVNKTSSFPRKTQMECAAQQLAKMIAKAKSGISMKGKVNKNGKTAVKESVSKGLMVLPRVRAARQRMTEGKSLQGYGNDEKVNKELKEDVAMNTFPVQSENEEVVERKADKMNSSHGEAGDNMGGDVSIMSNDKFEKNAIVVGRRMTRSQSSKVSGRSNSSSSANDNRVQGSGGSEGDSKPALSRISNDDCDVPVDSSISDKTHEKMSSQSFKDSSVKENNILVCSVSSEVCSNESVVDNSAMVERNTAQSSSTISLGGVHRSKSGGFTACFMSDSEDSVSSTHDVLPSQDMEQPSDISNNGIDCNVEVVTNTEVTAVEGFDENKLSDSCSQNILSMLGNQLGKVVCVTDKKTSYSVPDSTKSVNSQADVLETSISVVVKENVKQKDLKGNIDDSVGTSFEKVGINLINESNHGPIISNAILDATAVEQVSEDSSKEEESISSVVENTRTENISIKESSASEKKQRLVTSENSAFSPFVSPINQRQTLLSSITGTFPSSSTSTSSPSSLLSPASPDINRIESSVNSPDMHKSIQKCSDRIAHVKRQPPLQLLKRFVPASISLTHSERKIENKSLGPTEPLEIIIPPTPITSSSPKSSLSAQASSPTLASLSSSSLSSHIPTTTTKRPFPELWREMENFYKIPRLLSPLSSPLSSPTQISPNGIGLSSIPRDKKVNSHHAPSNKSCSDSQMMTQAKRILAKRKASLIDKTKTATTDGVKRSRRVKQIHEQKSEEAKSGSVRPQVRTIAFTGFSSLHDAIDYSLRHFLSQDLSLETRGVESTVEEISCQAKNGNVTDVWLCLVNRLILHIRKWDQPRKDIALEQLSRTVMADGFQSAQQQQQQMYLDPKETAILQLMMSFMAKHSQAVDRSVLMGSIWSAVFDQSLTNTNVRLSLCRLFCAACKEQGDLEQARILLYNIAWCGYLHLSSCLLSIVAVWPDVIQPPSVDTTGCPVSSPICQVFKLVLYLERNAAPDLMDGMLMVMKKVCGWDIRQAQPMGPNHLLTTLIEKLMETSQRHGNPFELMKATELLCVVMGSPWTQEFFVQKALIAAFQKWNMAMALNENADVLVAMLKIMKAVLLVQTFSDLTVRILGGQMLGKVVVTKLESLPLTIAFGEVLMDLLPLDLERIPEFLRMWEETNQGRLPSHILTQLSQAKSFITAANSKNTKSQGGGKTKKQKKKKNKKAQAAGTGSQRKAC